MPSSGLRARTMHDLRRALGAAGAAGAAAAVVAAAGDAAGAAQRDLPGDPPAARPARAPRKRRRARRGGCWLLRMIAAALVIVALARPVLDAGSSAARRPARCCWWSTTAGRRRRIGRGACRRRTPCWTARSAPAARWRCWPRAPDETGARAAGDAADAGRRSARRGWRRCIPSPGRPTAPAPSLRCATGSGPARPWSISATG